MLNGTIFQCFHWYSSGLSASLTNTESSATLSAEKAEASRGAVSEGAVCLWQQIAQDAARLAQVGFSALWLPPMTKGAQGAEDVGYNAYDLYDLGEFDQCGSVPTKYGDRSQLQGAIAEAHAVGLQVYGDVVLHRKHGGDGVETLEGTPVAWREPNRAVAPSQRIVAHSRFTFPGRGSRYNDMTWRGDYFQRVNHNCASHSQDGDSLPLSARDLLTGDGRQAGVKTDALYRLKIKTFAPEVDVRLGAQGQVCQSQGCFPVSVPETNALPRHVSETHGSETHVSETPHREDLPSEVHYHDASLVCELDLDLPVVQQALGDWGDWFVASTGVDGLRLDGAKHLPASFVREWLHQLSAASHARASQTDMAAPLFVMGDYWSNQVNDLHWYIAKSGGKLSLFDVPLHYNFHFASRQGRHYDLRNLMKGTLMAEQPALAVTFVENHNSQPSQLLESAVEAWFKPLAYGLILLRREGYPCVFAGDYYGADYVVGEGAGDAPIPAVKQDLRGRSRRSGRNRRSQERNRRVHLPSYQWLLDRLLFARSHCAYGEQYDYFEHPNLIGWTRLGNAEHPQAMAVLMSNHHSGEQWMEVGKPHTQFVDITQHLSESVWTNDEGWGCFGCEGSSISVWVEVPSRS
ncbi:MAG: alpha-amylase [Cyanobacteria bacterium P01_F01_bin.53]